MNEIRNARRNRYTSIVAICCIMVTLLITIMLLLCALIGKIDIEGLIDRTQHPIMIIVTATPTPTNEQLAIVNTPTNTPTYTPEPTKTPTPNTPEGWVEYNVMCPDCDGSLTVWYPPKWDIIGEDERVLAIQKDDDFITIVFINNTDGIEIDTLKLAYIDSKSSSDIVAFPISGILDSGHAYLIGTHTDYVYETKIPVMIVYVKQGKYGAYVALEIAEDLGNISDSKITVVNEIVSNFRFN